jgi:hypothetical protein
VGSLNTQSEIFKCQGTLYRILVRKPEGKRPLGRPRHRWVDSIEIDLKEREDGMVWTGSICLRIGTSGGLL